MNGGLYPTLPSPYKGEETNLHKSFSCIFHQQSRYNQQCWPSPVMYHSPMTMSILGAEDGDNIRNQVAACHKIERAHVDERRRAESSSDTASGSRR